MAEPENHTLVLLREIREDIRTSDREIREDIRKPDRKVDENHADLKSSMDDFAQTLGGEIAARISELEARYGVDATLN